MDIRDTALKYIGHRDHTVAEMRKYLKEKGYSSDEVEPLISSLKEMKYLDDQEYCRKYIPYSIRKGKGMHRIKRELMNKGIDPSVIDQAEEEEREEGESLGLSEYERALGQARKTVLHEELTEKLLGKVGRRLSTLGYSADTIYRVIRELKIKNGGNEDD